LVVYGQLDRYHTDEGMLEGLISKMDVRMMEMEKEGWGESVVYI
jgi:hypothetical protein